MKQVNFLIKPASSLCNMRCRYCFYADAEQHRRPREEVCMTGETVQRLVEAADRVLDDGGDAGFAFQGGEPTLQPLEFYESFVRACEPLRRRGIHLHLAMQTNGYALTPEWAEFLAREHVLTGVSVDGTGELHDRYRPDAGGNGTYARVTEHVRMLIRRGVDVNLLCVVHRETAGMGREVYESLKTLGTRYIQFIPCLDPLEEERGSMPWSLTAEDYGRFLSDTFVCWRQDWKRGEYVSVRMFEDWVLLAMNQPPSACAACGACGSYFVVEADGSLYPCDFYALDQWYMGRIGERSLAGLPGKRPMRDFVERAQIKPGACRTCRYWVLCRGGCPRDWTGTPPAHVNAWCDAYRKVFSAHADEIMEMAGAEWQARQAAMNR